MATGDGLQTAAQYDRRMRVRHFKVDGRSAQAGTPTVIETGYEYYADGAISTSAIK